MGSLVVAVVLLVVFWISWRREPRRLRLGVYLVLAAWFALGALLQLTRDLWPSDGVWALLPLLPVPLTVLALAGFLVANGLTMVRKEGRSLSNLLSLVVGGGLAVSGAALQGIFRNPLTDPGLIGVSSGAALGAVGLRGAQTAARRQPQPAAARVPGVRAELAPQP